MSHQRETSVLQAQQKQVKQAVRGNNRTVKNRYSGHSKNQQNKPTADNNRYNVVEILVGAACLRGYLAWFCTEKGRYEALTAQKTATVFV